MELLLLLALFLSIFIYYILKTSHDKKAPPGPKPLPVLGNLLDIARASDNPLLALTNLGKKYGEIYSLRYGFNDAVVLLSKRAITQVLSNEASFGRERIGIFYDRVHGKNIGLAASDGEHWVKSRAWTLRNLREFGFAKSSQMEKFIEEACQDLFKSLDAVDKIHCSDLLFATTTLRVIWQMLFGPVKPEQELNIKLLAEKSAALTKSASFSGAGIANVYVSLRFIIPKQSGYNTQMDFFKTSAAILKTMFQSYADNISEIDSSSQPKDFAEAFIRNIEADPEMFNCETFQTLFQDIFLGSTETTAAYMEAVLLYLVLYPEEQDKIYHEIKTASSSGKSPRYEDRKHMPYTQAFLLEVHRNAAVLQNFIPRVAMSDFEFNGYTIKKGTSILVDIYAHNHNPEVWTDSEMFNPSRFLKDGLICEKAKADMINFSVGKRNCLGEQYTNVMAFIMTTLVVQRYTLSIPSGHPKLSRDLNPGLTARPHPFYILFKRRELQ